MKEDFSYGVIPLMKKDNQWHTIMIKLSSWNHRWLPKWHPNPWETILETAIRELREETGLSIESEQVNTSILYKEQYEFFHPKKNDTILKTVWYYTVNIPYTDILMLKGYSEWDGEILDKKIVSLTEAIALATYDATRWILEDLYHNLENIKE